MRRYIDTDKLKEFYKPYAERKLSVPVDVILLNIDDMPTEDVQEVRHGRWQKDGQHTFICSVCGCEAYGDAFGEQKLSTYCPNCGSRMDVDGDTE